MADTTAVLDRLVFDFGFDIVDVVPALLKVLVERQYKTVAAGQSVSVTIYLIDNMTTPGRSYPFTAPIPPEVQFYTPLDISLGSAVSMRQSGDGIYSYEITAPATVGTYAAIFTCTNGLAEMVTKKHSVFTVI